jgi:hypothetical protein
MFKAIGLCLLLICTNASADSDDAAGPDDPACAAIKASSAFETFVQSYIAAINSKKPDALWACYYPKSVQIPAKDKEYADAVCEDSFSESIPATYEVALKALKPSDVNKMETDEGTTYPMRPTVRMGMHERLIYRVVLGLDDLPRFVLVASPQARLLARVTVFTIKHCPSAEHCESVLHSCLSLYGHVAKTLHA